MASLCISSNIIIYDYTGDDAEGMLMQMFSGSYFYLHLKVNKSDLSYLFFFSGDLYSAIQNTDLCSFRRENE